MKKKRGAEERARDQSPLSGSARERGNEKGVVWGNDRLSREPPHG